MGQQITPVPRTASFALTGSQGTVAAARDHARSFLGQGSPSLPEAQEYDALLLVSELVSNAVRHAPGPCTLTLALDDDGLLIAVRDFNSARPVKRAADLFTGRGGFGWNLLERLCDRLEVHPQRVGKTIRAHLARATSRLALPTVLAWCFA